VVRVILPKYTGFTRRGVGHLEASLTIEEPRSIWARAWRVLVGTPIHSELEIHERLPKKKALAVFSSDALSSVAYTPQETLVILADDTGRRKSCDDMLSHAVVHRTVLAGWMIWMRPRPKACWPCVKPSPSGTMRCTGDGCAF
jgi:hypothetical protein